MRTHSITVKRNRLGYWLTTVGILVSLLFCLGLYQAIKNESQVQQERTPELVKSLVVTVDGCEYYEVPSMYGHFTYTHKGNCKNPIHVQVR